MDQNWRVGHQGRDRMYYEELRDGTWQRLDIDGEMLVGRAHHVIYFATPERWRGYPAWARDRREEIIARIKSEFRAPDYEYHESAAAATVPPRAAGRPHAARMQGSGALLLFIAIFLVLAGSMGWLVQNGLSQGQTWWPAKRAALSRVVARAEEPVMYWTSIGLYAAIGAGSLGFAGWLIRAGLRRGK